MDKKQFISAILNDPSLKQKDRERVIALLVGNFVDKAHLVGDTDAQHTAGRKMENGWVHDPRAVCQFLKKFSGDPVLRNTVHDWVRGDFESFDDFISKVGSALKGYDTYKNMYRYNVSLNYSLRNFLGFSRSGGEFKWGGEKIQIGLQYPEGAIKKWMEDNPEQKDFMSMPLSAFPEENQPKSRYGGKTIANMEDLCNFFKCSIEFRDESPFSNMDFEGTVRAAFRNKDFRTTYRNIGGYSFYVYTPAVRNALNSIAHNIKGKVASSTEVSVFTTPVDGDNGAFELHILHIGSHPGKRIDNEKLKRGDMSRLRCHKPGRDDVSLMSVCDFAVQGMFRDENDNKQAYRIDYLYPGLAGSDDYPEVRITKLDHELEGFEYILRFYTK